MLFCTFRYRTAAHPYVPNIFEAKAEDFISATHRVHRDRQHASALILPVLPAADEG